MYIIQSYIPSKNREKFAEYIETLNDLVDSYTDKGLVILMGDMNCHVNSMRVVTHLDGRDLFLESNKLTTVTTLACCGGAEYTYQSYNGSSIIDHILFPNDDVNMIASCQIVDDESILISNPRPTTCSFTVPISNSSNTCNITPLSHVLELLEIGTTHVI